jgi:hypothetical protein
MATTKAGCRASSVMGRPAGAPAGGATCGAKRTKLITTSPSSATPTSARYAPTKGVANQPRVALARLGPRNAPTTPPASTQDSARSRKAGATSSVPAKRYSAPLAL